MYLDAWWNRPPLVMESALERRLEGVHATGDGKYIYNLATEVDEVGLPYTVVIRDPGTNSFVSSFLIQPKK